MLLSALKEGASAAVRGFIHSDEKTLRLADIGLTPGCAVKCIQHSPLGDPTAYLIRGAVIALRKEDADLVLLED